MLNVTGDSKPTVSKQCTQTISYNVAEPLSHNCYKNAVYSNMTIIMIIIIIIIIINAVLLHDCLPALDCMD